MTLDMLPSVMIEEQASETYFHLPCIDHGVSLAVLHQGSQVTCL